MSHMIILVCFNNLNYNIYDHKQNPQQNNSIARF